MLKKLVWLIVLLFVVYVLLVFKAPWVASEIEKAIWIEWFGSKIIESKDKFDYAITKIPTKEELQWAYSWALDKITEAKEVVDDLRIKAWELEDTYNKASDFIDETSQKIEQAKEIVDNIKEVIWSGSTSSWETESWTTEQ